MKIKKSFKWFVIKSFFPFLPVKKNKIFIESYFGNKVDGNPYYLLEYIVDDERFKDYTFVMVDNKDYMPFKNVIYVKKFAYRYMFHITTSKYVISNLRIGKRFKKKKKQIYVQTWHGTPLKRLVHDMVSFELSLSSKEKYLANFDNDVAKWDILLSPNDYSTEKLTSAFQYHGKIVNGYPRNYPLTKEYNLLQINELKRKIGIKNLNDKVYLYTPTFRDTEKLKRNQYVYSLQVDLEKLAAIKNKVFLIRAHYLIANDLDIEHYPNIIDVSDYPKINDLFIASDCLINDYSSTMFDYGYLNKPVILYPYDLDTYENDVRGFYFDYKTLSNNICYTEEQLLKTIQNDEEQKLLVNFTPKIDLENLVSEIFNV